MLGEIGGFQQSRIWKKFRSKVLKHRVLGKESLDTDVDLRKWVYSYYYTVNYTYTLIHFDAVSNDSNIHLVVFATFLCFR